MARIMAILASVRFFLSSQGMKLIILQGCYIKSNYTAERLVTDYVWVWLTGVVMVVLYSYMAVQVYRLNLGINNRARKIARKLML